MPQAQHSPLLEDLLEPLCTEKKLGWFRFRFLDCGLLTLNLAEPWGHGLHGSPTQGHTLVNDQAMRLQEATCFFLKPGLFSDI